MNKERFLELHKQYCEETAMMSMAMTSHPAYIELVSAGKIAIPWALERLKDTIGRDEGDSLDISNSPHLSSELISKYTDSKCFYGFPKKYAGMVDVVRDFLLKWGESEGLI